MDILDLPDELIVKVVIEHTLVLHDLFELCKTCKRFKKLIDAYDLWYKFVKLNPIIDFNYPYGFSNYDEYRQVFFGRNIRLEITFCLVLSALSKKMRTHKYKLRIVRNWMSGKYTNTNIYQYPNKMLPHLQIDDIDGSLYFTDANRLVYMKLNENNYNYDNKSHTQTLSLCTSNEDIKGFIKKDDYIFTYTNRNLNGYVVKETSYPTCENNTDSAFYMHKEKNLSLHRHIKESTGDINCFDFSIKNDRIIYGCKNGIVKIFKLEDYENSSDSLKIANISDRILRTVYSPSNDCCAIGTAGINSYLDISPCPLRIFNSETLQLDQILMPSNTNVYMKGAGVLALSFIDENILLSAGYDTFIRIFDLRINKCVQTFEEPEDTSIYCVCCSKSNGMLSGNDRFALIRYWDRRMQKIVQSFTAANVNSPIYSMASTPEAIFASWERGVSLLNFNQKIKK